MRFGAVLLLAVTLAACSADDDPGPAGTSCDTRADCPASFLCVDSRCVAGSPDAGAPDGGPVCACTAGEVCNPGGTCRADCGDPAASPCAAGDACDFATGNCVASGTAGALTGPDVSCGAAPMTRSCRPGTECALDGQCVPAAPCFARTCTPDGTTCWGSSCVTSRPAGACSPAPLERLNMDDFIRGGDGGAIDLEFDDACNAYTVTMISGTDYLRQVAPDGTFTVWNGVLNLNMGEVAVLRRPGGEFGAGDGLGEVALTYICCASCGCFSGDRQGVARLDRAGTTSLPMVVLADPSEGVGPWGIPTIDTGPYGLTWGRDNRLYIGNVVTNGDLVRADLDTGTTMEIHRLAARVHATAVFDTTTLLVALEGGAVHRVHVDLPLTAPWAEIGEHVISMVRDPFTGHVYLTVASGRILEYSAGGAPLGELAPAPGAQGRIAYAPDGFLYHLVPGWPGDAAVTRYELPETL